MVGIPNIPDIVQEECIFLSNGEKCKMHKIEWCERGLQLSDIGTKNVSKPDLTPRLKYIMVRLEN